MFTESRELIAVSLAASAVGGIIVALLLYGAHKVSTQNKSAFFSKIVMFPNSEIN
jgi:hypothetical protein